MIPEVINKDKNIQTLIEYLFNKYGRFKIKDHWNGDECAIGLIDLSENYLIYISTIGLEESGYYVVLENPPKENEELPYEPAGEFNNIGLEELEKLFVKHLRINKKLQQPIKAKKQAR